MARPTLVPPPGARQEQEGSDLRQFFLNSPNDQELHMQAYAVFQFPLEIRERHLDLFGHVNNAAYLHIYEEARWDVIHGAGFGLDRILSERTGPIVLDLAIRFRRELTCRQKVTVKSQVKESRGRIWVLKQWIEDSQGVIYSEAHFTLGLMDLDKRKLVPLTPAWANAVGMMTSGSQDN